MTIRVGFVPSSREWGTNLVTVSLPMNTQSLDQQLYVRTLRGALHLLTSDVHVTESKDFGLHGLSLRGLERGDEREGATGVKARQGVPGYSSHCPVGA
jgi:hypothetical protein